MVANKGWKRQVWVEEKQLANLVEGRIWQDEKERVTRQGRLLDKEKNSNRVTDAALWTK